MANVKTIRALSRGLEVLRTLEAGGPATLHALSLKTGLPKPTLLRLLATLEDAGYVRRGIGDQLYHHNIRAPLPAANGWKSILAEVAAPILDRLCNAVLWPSDLGIYEDGIIHVQETTRRLSPFLINPDVLRADIDVLPSAMGRAVLAWSGPARRDEILRRLSNSSRSADAPAKDRRGIERLVQETLDKGYATRRRGYFISFRREADVSAIARPILINGEAVGAVNLTWVSSALSERDFAQRYLGQLSAIATEISERLNDRVDGTALAVL